MQFWRDVPGDANPRKQKVCLGICRTRTIAERAAAEKLEQLGINSTQTFIETTSTITFKDQGQICRVDSSSQLTAIKLKRL